MLEVQNLSYSTKTFSIALYAKHGFHPVGKTKNYYDAPKEDAVLMTCYLK